MSRKDYPYTHALADIGEDGKHSSLCGPIAGDLWWYDNDDGEDYWFVIEYPGTIRGKPFTRVRAVAAWWRGQVVTCPRCLKRIER